MPPRSPIRTVHEAAAALRRRVGLAIGGAAIAALLVLFLSVSLLPRSLLIDRGSPVPLLASLGIACLVGLAAWAATATRRRLQPRRLAREAEVAAQLGEGDMSAALDFEPASDSRSDLAELHLARVAERVAHVDPDQLFGERGVRWRHRRSAALTATGLGAGLLVLAAALRPDPTLATARALATSWRTAFPPPRSPISVAPGDTAVARGRRLAVRVGAPGRDRARLVWQVEGERPVGRNLELAADGSATGRTNPITARARYWVVDEGGASSDTFRVRPLEPLLVERLEVRLAYPAYLGRAPDRHVRPLPPLILPEGTDVWIEGSTNHALESGELRPPVSSRLPSQPAGVDPVQLEIEGRRLSARFRPRTSGAWHWWLRAADVLADPVLPEPLELVVLPDELPSARIVFPARDTVLGPDRGLPLLVEVADDLGLASAEIVVWVGSSAPSAPRRLSIGDGIEDRREVVLQPYLDLSDSAMLPGDTAFYAVTVRDRNPAHPAVSTDTFRLFESTLEQRAERVARRTRGLGRTGEALAEEARSLERAAREAERRAGTAPGVRPTPGRDADPADFETTGGARALLQRARALQKHLAEQGQRLRTLEREVGDSPLRDPRLRETLEELAASYEALAEESLGAVLRPLEEALGRLDPAALREALRRLVEESERLARDAGRQAGLTERAALEQTLKASRSEAERLADRQGRLADRMAEGQSAGEGGEWRREEGGLAEEAESLARSLDTLRTRLADSGADRAAEATAQAAPLVSTAADRMREAADSGGEAARSRAAAREAAEAMSDAASALGSAEGSARGEWRAEVTEAAARARREALELARLQDDLIRRTAGSEAIEGAEWQARQVAIRRGLENLRRALAEATERSSGEDPETARVAEEVATRMEAVLDRLAESGGTRRPSRREGDAISEGLNALALRLLANEQAKRGSGAEGAAQEAIDQMNALAMRQQGVSQRTTGAMAEPTRLPPESLARLSGDQAEIGRELEGLSPDLNRPLGRPEELAREAREISEEISRGAISAETLARQRRLFRRMLDAGRSLQQDELDPEGRESRTGRTIAREIPPLDPGARSGPRFPLPSEATLRRLPAAYRHLVLDYFDRLNRSATDRAGETTAPEQRTPPRRPDGSPAGDVEP